jgi:ABC-2 type transport system permease protein
MIISCCALGMTISSCTKNQLIALSLSFISIMILWFLMGVAPLLSHPFSDILSYLSLLTHIETMSKGLIHTKDLFYFFSFVSFFLFVCTQRVEAYRWQ